MTQCDPYGHAGWPLWVQWFIPCPPIRRYRESGPSDPASGALA
jgi:hypothetical protein